jgi:hypothetical protein
MALELTAVAPQVVPVNGNIVFTETPVGDGRTVLHREGSGIITLRGSGTQCRARYKVTFNANLAVPTGETVGAIQVALSLQGEPLASTTMIVTPAAVEEYFNVSATAFIEVPCGCCQTLGVRNTSAIPISVQNANIVVERVA